MDIRPTLHPGAVSPLRRWSCALLAVLLPSFVAAQAVISPSNSQVFAGGKVYAIVRQTDNKVIIGGDFTYVNGTARNNIARINSDGSLDATWNPSADNIVYALVLDGAGNVLVGGAFHNIGGLSRTALAKITLAGTGGADATWNPNSNGGVNALALDPLGPNVYVGGNFTAMGGQPRAYIAKVATGGTGAADATWNPNPDSSGGFVTIFGPGVTGVAADTNGNVFVSGNFAHIGGHARVALAKLSGSGTGAADPAWDPHPLLGSQIPWYVGPIAQDPTSGALYVGGYFDSVGGQFRNCLAKLSPNGSGAADPAWDPNPRGQVSALAVDPAGTVYVSGVFGSIGGLQHAWMARVSGTGIGAVDATWDPLPHWTGRQVIPGIFAGIPGSAFAFDAGGNVFAGGSFVDIGGQTKTGFAYLSASGVGAANPAWASAMIGGTVAALARDGTGRTVIAGSFEFMGDGVTVRNNLARLDAAGNLDAAWVPEANEAVAAIALDGSGNVYAGGSFTVVGGQSRQFIAKLAATGAGAADATWNPNADAAVTALAFDQANSTVFAGGAFANIGGHSRVSLAKLSATGTGAGDATWNPNPTIGYLYPPISALVLDGAGKLYTGGTFSSVGGQSRNNIARLSTSGSGAADAGWNPNADAAVVAIALDASGNVYVGGNYFNIAGLAREGIARLSVATGAADPAWSPNGFGVDAIVLDGAGYAYLGGGFFGIGGSARAHIARVSTGGIGTADCTWIADAGSPVLALARDGSGNIYAGGIFGYIAGTSRNGYAVIGTGTSPGCRVAITSVNAGFNPSVNAPFPVVVHAQDSLGLPQNVATSTVVTLSLNTGTGVLGGNLSCQINAGADTCTISGVTYSKAESGVVLTISRTSGDTLTSGNSAPLTIVATQPPAKLTFTDVNGGVDPIAGVGFPVTVQAQEANGNPVNVVADTNVSFAFTAGTGSGNLQGPPAFTAPSCGILTGTNSCTLPQVIYDKAESGVVLSASAPYAAGVIAGNSAPFTVDEPPVSRVLTVLSQTGSVTSNPPGINCDWTHFYVCSAAFPTGTPVTLSYVGNLGSWGGDCSGPSCSLVMNSDKTVSVNVGTSFVGSSIAWATQVSTTIVGNQTLRVDQTRTQIVGRYQGAIVYDQTVIAAFTDPAVQAAIAAAASAVRTVAANPSLKTTPATLTGTADTVVATSVAFSDAVTALPFGVTTTMYIGPVILPIGALGICVLAPFNCAGPHATITMSGGAANFLTLIVDTLHTDRTVITTDTHALTSTYQLDDNPFAATITSTALISSQNPSTVGQPVTFTATVSNGASITGNVQFKNGVANLGAPVPLNGTTAALTTSALPAGTRAITATYSGDATNGSSTSPAVNQVVSGGVGTDANLSALTVSSGSLSPAFASGTLAYTEGVLNCVASMTVTPTLEDPAASVKVNGATVASGTHSAAISLAVGANPINAVVTAQDGVTTKTYALAVTRAAPPPLVATLQSAVSRRVHGAAGTFDLPLSLAATNPTTEPRTGPNQSIVFTFDKAISGAAANISEGAATAGAPTLSGNNVVVALTGVSNQQYVTVALANVTSTDGGTGGCASVRLGFLAGDVNQNRVVTLADLGFVNAQLAQSVTSANFLKDVNASGTLTLTDKGLTNLNLTKALPPP